MGPHNRAQSSALKQGSKPSVARRAGYHSITGLVIATRPTPPLPSSPPAPHSPTNLCKTQRDGAGSPLGNTRDANGTLSITECHKHTGLYRHTEWGWVRWR